MKLPNLRDVISEVSLSALPDYSAGGKSSEPPSRRTSFFICMEINLLTKATFWCPKTEAAGVPT